MGKAFMRTINDKYGDKKLSTATAVSAAVSIGTAMINLGQKVPNPVVKAVSYIAAFGALGFGTADVIVRTGNYMDDDYTCNQSNPISEKNKKKVAETKEATKEAKAIKMILGETKSKLAVTTEEIEKKLEKPQDRPAPIVAKKMTVDEAIEYVSKEIAETEKLGLRRDFSLDNSTMLGVLDILKNADESKKTEDVVKITTYLNDHLHSYLYTDSEDVVIRVSVLKEILDALKFITSTETPEDPTDKTDNPEDNKPVEETPEERPIKKDADVEANNRVNASKKQPAKNAPTKKPQQPKKQGSKK